MPNAVVMTGYGPPDVLTWAQVPLPEPGQGQIRIKVKAADISSTDLAMRAGYLKAIPLPVGTENPCHQAILMNHAPGAVTSLNPEQAWPLACGSPKPTADSPAARQSAGTQGVHGRYNPAEPVAAISGAGPMRPSPSGSRSCRSPPG
jgi:hypothetical protein